jgi:hypothetical protein
MTTRGTDRQKAEHRFAAIAALIELASLPDERIFPRLMPDGQPVSTWTEAAQWCAANTGRSLRGIWRIWAAFKRGGKAALQRRARSDKGNSRFFRLHPPAAAFAAYLFMAWTRNVRTIFLAMERNAAALGVRVEELPSYETLRKWLRSCGEHSLVSSALRGQKAYRARANQDAKFGFLSRKGQRAA